MKIISPLWCLFAFWYIFFTVSPRRLLLKPLGLWR